MNHKRRASMLVELVLLMSGGSAVMLTAIILMHRSMEMTSKFQAISETQTAYTRLSSIFRSDVYRASEVHHDSERSVRLMRPDRATTLYEVADGSIVRTETTAAGQKKYERFRIPHGAVVQWSSEPMNDAEEASAGRMEWMFLRRPIAPQLSQLRLDLSVAASAPPRKLSPVRGHLSATR